MQIEYRVRPVTRYIVTRWFMDEAPGGLCSGGSVGYGEFDNPHSANDVCAALAQREPVAVCTLAEIVPEFSPPKG